MRTLPVAILMLGLLGSPISAASPFRVVSAEGAGGLDRQLQQAASDGYRLVGACHGAALDGRTRIVALMQLGPSGSGAHEYATLELPGDMGDEGALDEVNRLAADGYRLLQERVFARPLTDSWLPPSAFDDQLVLIMERGPRAIARHYDTLAYGSDARFEQQLSQLYDEGYDAFGLWLSSRRPRVLLERPLETVPDRQRHVDPPYRLLVRATKHALKHGLERFRTHGYGIVDIADQSILAPPVVLMSKQSGATRPSDLKLMDHPLRMIRRDRLERKLNRRARKGFRVVPRSLSDSLILLTRGPGKRQPWQYRVLSSKEAPGLPRAMEQGVSDGYRLVAMFHASDETTVVLEREGRLE